MTLLQLFDFYQQRNTVGGHIAQEALTREKEGYQAAELIVCHSHWAAQSVMDYGIDAKKVHVVVPGANLDRDAYRAWESSRRLVVGSGQQNRQGDKGTRRQGDEKPISDFPLPPHLPVSLSSDPLRLVFVGKYWQRKGLDRLLEALQIVHRRGMPVQLQVIGCDRLDLPVHLRQTPNVEWLGFLDKRRELARFL